MIKVTSPGSTANLGSGFDVLALALEIYSVVSTDGDGQPADEHHPASVAFEEAGGVGRIWVETEIPMGRGLGYSASVRVAAATAAYVQLGLDDTESVEAALSTASVLEGHSDNAAASALGGAVITAGDTVVQLALGLDAAIVVWVPGSTKSATDSSRLALPEFIQLEDVVTNLGNVALLTTALTSGDTRLLRQATQDLVHQPGRLDALPDSAAALEAMVELGAWGAWLSGSGPSVAAFVDRSEAETIASRLPRTGHFKVLELDQVGTRIARDD